MISMRQIFKWVMVLLGIFYMSSHIYAQNCESLLPNTDSLKSEMTKQKTANKEMAARMQFQYFVIKAANYTFGYNVYADGHLYLHQPIIPGVAGNNGFADTATAGRVARFAISKIKMGEIPPTITQEELKQLKVKVP